MVNFSGPQLALSSVVAVARAVLGRNLAETGKRNHRRTSWCHPSLANLPLGTLGTLGTGPGLEVVEPIRSVGSDFPAYPRRADGRSTVPSKPVSPAAPAAPVTPPERVAHESPPKWHPDPSGRFHFRWWMGTEWTSYVSTHGRVEIDTSPDQRTGPYPS